MAVFLVIDNIRGTGILKIAMVSLGLDRPVKDDQWYKWTIVHKFSASGRKHFIFASINFSGNFKCNGKHLKNAKKKYLMCGHRCLKLTIWPNCGICPASLSVKTMDMEWVHLLSELLPPLNIIQEEITSLELKLVNKFDHFFLFRLYL